MNKKLILIQLNEINFDLVEKYILGSKKINIQIYIISKIILKIFLHILKISMKS